MAKNLFLIENESSPLSALANRKIRVHKKLAVLALAQSPLFSGSTLLSTLATWPSALTILPTPNT